MNNETQTLCLAFEMFIISLIIGLMLRALSKKLFTERFVFGVRFIENGLISFLVKNLGSC